MPALQRLCPPGMRWGSLLAALRPLPPGMILHRVLAERRQLLDELPAHRHRESRSDADMLEHAAVIVESQEQRADRVPSALVPAESGDHTVGRARRASPSSWRACPADRGCPPAWRSPRPDRRLRSRRASGLRSPGLASRASGRAAAPHRQAGLRGVNGARLRRLHQALPIGGEQVERDERRRRLLRQLLHPRCGGMQPASGARRSRARAAWGSRFPRRRHSLGQALQQRLMQLREIAVERAESRLWMNRSDALRNTMARNPSHFGSKSTVRRRAARRRAWRASARWAARSEMGCRGAECSSGNIKDGASNHRSPCQLACFPHRERSLRDPALRQEA